MTISAMPRWAKFPFLMHRTMAEVLECERLHAISAHRTLGPDENATLSRALRPDRTQSTKPSGAA